MCIFFSACTGKHWRSPYPSKSEFGQPGSARTSSAGMSSRGPDWERGGCKQFVRDNVSHGWDQHECGLGIPSREAGTMCVSLVFRNLCSKGLKPPEVTTWSLGYIFQFGLARGFPVVVLRERSLVFCQINQSSAVLIWWVGIQLVCQWASKRLLYIER